MSNFAFLCPVENHGRMGNEFGKQLRIKKSKFSLISNQLFYKVSNFETRNWKRVRLPTKFIQLIKFWIELLQRVRFWINFFTTRQLLESKILQRIRLWSEIVFRKTKYAGKLNFKNNSFLILSHGNNVKKDNFMLTWNFWFCERM